MGLFQKPKYLSPDDCHKIHEASLRVLNKIGIVFHHPEVLEILKNNGAKVDNKKVYFPKSLVESALKHCPDSFFWKARNPEHSMTVGGLQASCLFQPNLGPVYVHDLDHGRRNGTKADFVNFQKLTQASQVIQLAGALPVDACDLPQKEKHARLMAETLRHSDKPVIGFGGHLKQVEQQLDLVKIAFDDSEVLKNNHCIAVSVNPLSPLAFSTDALETILAYTKNNQPLFIPPAVMTGVTGPASFFGTIILQNVEILAALTLIQLLNPGNPTVYCTASVVTNMRRACFNTGAPEGLMIHAAGLQMGKDFYNMPTRSLCGYTESKEVDFQAGIESMGSLMMSMMTGCDIAVEFIGCLDSIMTTSYEKMIIDEEVISRMRCLEKGFDTSDQIIEEAFEAIQQAGPGGSYLTLPSTLNTFRSYWEPSVMDWRSYDDWENDEKRSLVHRANAKFKTILKEAPQTMIDEKLDQELRRYCDSAIY
ncbi:MAG: trimethylamine--corrinoid methyltransferase [Deltaproteobacteria bacterium]|jgi:trimethylamine---corrinoid protein Co-methyltransferase|nr:trimethylamine--corrinoid methyltransferase [Deltaproteobacteria bacterium]